MRKGEKREKERKGGRQEKKGPREQPLLLCMQGMHLF